MLEPKKAKFRNVHRGNTRGMAMRGNHVAFGSYGLKAIEPDAFLERRIARYEKMGVYTES